MLHPDFIPTPSEASVARMWSRRLNHVEGFNAAYCKRLARKLDYYRRSGAGDLIVLFCRQNDRAMATALGTAYGVYHAER